MNSDNWQLNAFIYSTSLERHLSSRIANTLRQAIADNGRASLVVSGGSTPKGLFRQLSTEALEWERVWVTLADERWVSEQHEDSNARLVKEHLLQNSAAKANFQPLVVEGKTPYEAEKIVSESLEHIPLPYDVVVLGMGGDGHTASFFSDAFTFPKAIDSNTKQRCVAISPNTAPHDRMTQTLATLINSSLRILQISGKQKIQVLSRAMRAGSNLELPVRAVLHASKVSPLQIYYTDQE